MMPADLVLTNGVILTLDPKARVVEALAAHMTASSRSAAPPSAAGALAEGPKP